MFLSITTSGTCEGCPMKEGCVIMILEEGEGGIIPPPHTNISCLAHPPLLHAASSITSGSIEWIT